MIVYDSVYLRLEFFKEHTLLEFTWLPSTVDLTDEQYKEELFAYLNSALELKPRRSIMNLTNFFYTTSPVMQEWTEQKIVIPVLAAGGTEMAVVMSTEFITQLATEQIIEESSSVEQITSKYFGTVEEAREWILSFSNKEVE